jgi:hypothetical protein
MQDHQAKAAHAVRPRARIAMQRIATFFSNGGYATWFQSLIIIVSVIVAVYAIQATDSSQSRRNSVLFAQRYFTDRPTLANAALRLRISQYLQVQEAKKRISGYDDRKDAGFGELFEVARPLVRQKIVDTPELQADYQAVNDFFSGLLVCIGAGVCDRATAVRLLGWELLGFYNAVCPYQESVARTYGYDEDSDRYLGFLVDSAHYMDPDKQYFCRDRLTSLLAKHR